LANTFDAAGGIAEGDLVTERFHRGIADSQLPLECSHVGHWYIIRSPRNFIPSVAGLGKKGGLFGIDI